MQDTAQIFLDTSWIGVPESEYTAKRQRRGIETAYFRLKFHCAQTESLKISISASSRYRLWVNGNHVTYGPCKGDRWRHFYETVDIGSYLVEGENLLAVKVVSYPPYESQRGDERGPLSIMAKALGPCLAVTASENDSDEKKVQLTSGKAPWEVFLDDAIDWRFFKLSSWMGSMEHVTGERLPMGWEIEHCTHDGWSKVAVIEPAVWENEARFGTFPTFPLKPRPIPLPFEKKRGFVREMQLKAPDAKPFTFDSTRKGATVPPNACMAIELDAGEYITGFTRFSFEGGKGSKVTLRYAECYSRMENSIMVKGQRDDCEHYELIGHEDAYFPSGGVDTYEPFWFRTFRFIRIEVETADESLTVHMPTIAETGYPLEVHSYVNSPEPWVGRLWDISLLTLRRCMHETYVDCPYYEQLQYIQDTRLEMLFTYMVSGDTRMALRAIEDFHYSLLPDGMLQARFPSAEPHVIPPFSLHWVSMLLEYFEQTGDIAVPRRYRPTVDAILDWYDRKIGAYGLVEKLGYWDFIDWVDQWVPNEGRTPAAAVGPATTHNLMYAAALLAGAEINRITGRDGIAQEYEARAVAIKSHVEQYCWSETEQLYMEGPGFEEYSQHAQVFAVLSGLAEGDKARDIVMRSMEKTGISACTFATQFFLFRALEKCGAYDLTEKQWDLWKMLLDNNLTTVPEVPEGNRLARSECHAWGSLALYEFTRCLLGVRPAAPGWEKIIIQPHTLSLPAASGQVVTPKGAVCVSWTSGGDGFDIQVDAPKGVPVELILPDGTKKSYAGGC